MGSRPLGVLCFIFVEGQKVVIPNCSHLMNQNCKHVELFSKRFHNWFRGHEIDFCRLYIMFSNSKVWSKVKDLKYARCYHVFVWHNVYMVLKSANDCWVGHTSLSWIMRVQIALDAARGIEYIHEHTKTHYVHRDIKTSNILLDGAFRAKVFTYFALSIYLWNHSDLLIDVLEFFLLI